MTFIDLKNAFESVPHGLIRNILSAIRLPSQIQLYISDAYSQLEGFLSTKHWSSTHFHISRGVFQGDTLSPIVFLLAFTPIIKYAQSLLSKGFFFKIPLTDSENLPDPQVPIYIYWNEPISPDLPGWYLCTTQCYCLRGTATIQYSDGQTEDEVDLHSIQWIPAARNRKHYVPLAAGPPKPSTRTKLSGKPKSAWSSDHKVKVFADDITLFHLTQLLTRMTCCLWTQLALSLASRFDLISALLFISRGRKCVAIS